MGFWLISFYIANPEFVILTRDSNPLILPLYVFSYLPSLLLYLVSLNSLINHYCHYFRQIELFLSLSHFVTLYILLVH